MPRQVQGRGRTVWYLRNGVTTIHCTFSEARGKTARKIKVKYGYKLHFCTVINCTELLIWCFLMQTFVLMLSAENGFFCGFLPSVSMKVTAKTSSSAVWVSDHICVQAAPFGFSLGGVPGSTSRSWCPVKGSTA